MKKIKHLLFAGIFTAVMSLSISATASAEAVDIPSSAKVWNGHSYYLYKQTMKFSAAQAYCEARGGHLAVIDNAAENQMLTEYLAEQKCEAAMIGLYDADGSNGSWSTWVTGKSTNSYTNWGYKQPDWAGQTICVLNSTPNSYYGWEVGQWDNGWNGDYHFLCEWETSDRLDLEDASITLSPQEYTYNGFARKPSVTVEFLNENGKFKTLKKNTDYTVSYSDNKRPGEATVTVTGVGKYTGTNRETFDIVPRSPSSLSLKKEKSAKVTMTWKRQKEAEYDEIEYSTSRDFENSKTISTKGNGMTFEDAKNPLSSKKKYTFTGLKPKTKYYIRIRSWANNQCSKWEGKTIKTKK